VASAARKNQPSLRKVHGSESEQEAEILSAQAESKTVVVPHQEPGEPATEQSATLEPFELTAGPLPLHSPAQGRKAPRIIEEQLAFNFSAL
jgi:hypothetical protein